MKIKLTLFLLLTASALINAQSIIYNNSFKLGTTGLDGSVAVKTNSVGEFIIAGNLEGLTDFDPSAATVTLSPLGQKDMFIAKYDGAGNFIWVKHIGSIGGETMYDMDLDALGNIIIAGEIGYTIDMNPGAGTNTLALTYSGNVEGFVAKYDANGNFIWAKKVQDMNTSSYTRVSQIDVNVNNEIYIAGYFSGTIGFDNFGTVMTNISAGGSDIYFSRMSATGTFLYRSSIGGSANEDVRDISANGANEVLICGEFQSSNFDIDPTPTTSTLSLSGTKDGFAAKYNTMGNLMFGFKSGSTAVDHLSACTFDNTGNIILAGLYMGTVDFDPGVSTATITIPVGFGVCLSSYNSTGVFSWVKRISYSTINTDAASLLIDASNNILLSGYFTGTNDFDPSPSSTYTLSSSGGLDAYYTSFSNLGLFNWAFKVGGTGHDMAIDMAYFNNSYYITGTYDAAIDMDPGTATASLPFSNGDDIFLGIYTYSCTAHPAPLNATPPASLAICAGKSASLTISGPGVLNWYASATSTTVINTGPAFTTPTLSAGSYTYYAEANSCTASSRTPLTVTVNPLPTITISGVNPICYGSPAVLTASGAATYVWSNSATTASISVGLLANYTFTVTGTSSDGCKNTATKSVTVSPIPNVTISSSPSTICNGQVSVLTAGGAGTYVWSNSSTTNSIVVTPSVTASYSVIGTTASNCTNTAVKTVSVIPGPNVNAVTTNSLLCAGETATISASGAVSYVWNNSATTSQIVISPGVTTTYTVNGYGANGCMSSVSITQNVSLCTGIEEKGTGLNSLLVFPNPVIKELSIQSHKKEMLHLTNELGQVIKIIELDQHNDFSYHLDDLPAGVYFLIGKSIRQKIIVMN